MKDAQAEIRRLRRRIRILEQKLVIARNEWELDQGVGTGAMFAQIATQEAEAKLKRMKLTKREEEI